MYNNREKLLDWLQADVVKNDNLAHLIDIANAKPSTEQWLVFTKQALLWLAVICSSVGVIFFFAYNWQELTRVHRFALVETAMLAASFTYLRISANLQLSKGLLMGMVLLTGSLLALVGQTYQTGADPWQLFAVWAAFITPWALSVNSSVIWIFWAGLINLSFSLYIDISNNFFWFHASNRSFILILCTINCLFLIAFELHKHYFQACKSHNRYTQQVLASAAGCCISFWAISNIFEEHISTALNVSTYLSWIIITSAIYRFLLKDLFIIAICSLSFLAVSTFYLIEFLDSSNLEALLLLSAIYILGVSTAIGYYLKRVAKLFDDQTNARSLHSSHSPLTPDQSIENQEQRNG